MHDEGTDTDVARRRMADATNWAARQPWMLTSAEVRGRRNRLVARRPAIAFGTIVTAGALIGSLAGAGVFSTPAASKSSPTQTQALQSFPPSVQAAAPGPGGVVVGRLVEVGGPTPGTRVSIPGQVTATSASGRHRTVGTAPNGSFRLSLPAGTYRLTGHSPRVLSSGREMQCRSERSAYVRDGWVTRGVLVICSVS